MDNDELLIMKSPIFIFSLPRAGSTLLQRILLSHKSIGGTPEPWLLLPFIYALREKGSISEYSSKLSKKGLEDVLNSIPNGKKQYYKELNEFISSIYSKFLKAEEVYFLDKTPRYYYIIEDLYEIFPQAKFIFLFRNPVQVYASILNTWCDNSFAKLYGSHNDLMVGFKKLSESYKRHKHDQNTFALKYDDLVKNPSEVLKEIQTFLEVDYNQELQYNFVKTKMDTSHYLGDPTGIKKYKSISSETLKKWTHTFNTRFRKRIIRNYIEKTLNDHDLEIQGFSKKTMLEEVQSVNNKGRHGYFKDLLSYFIYKTFIKYNLYLFFSKSTKWLKKTFIS